MLELAKVPLRRPRARSLAALCRATLALVVVMGVTLVRPGPSKGAGGEQEGALVVYRLRGGAVEVLRDGQLAAAGDRIQLVYDAGSRPHGVLFSVDGDARVTLHHPAAVAEPTRLERPRGPLPHSFVLDAAPRYERFYFVIDDAPLDARALLAAAGRDRKPSFLLRKQDRAPSRAEVR